MEPIADDATLRDRIMSTAPHCPNGHPLPAPGADCPYCLTPQFEDRVPLPSQPILPTVPGYQVLAELGRGGMGVVYKARHTSLDRVVALKMIGAGVLAGSDERLRFQSEAKIVARLRHPGIVQIYEVGDALGQLFFALEFVDGGTLGQKIQGAFQPPQASAALIERLARAMHHAHEQGVVHRDLKPANVLLTRDGEPKVTDFGLAKAMHSDQSRTASGAVLGTPGYMAPEQARGKSRSRPFGAAVDVYGLGAILYEMLTGRPPFLGETVLDALHQVMSAMPLPPSRLRPGLPRDLETICLKCLEKEPRHRYGTAQDLAEDLRRYLNHEPIKARAPGPAGRLVRWCRRHPVVAALSATVAVVFVLGFAGVTWKWLDADFQKGQANIQREAAVSAHAAATISEDRAIARAADAEREKSNAEKAREDARKAEADALALAKAEAEAKRKLEGSLHVTRINLAHREWQAAHVFRADEILGECSSDMHFWEWRYLKRLCHPEVFAVPAGRVANHVGFSGDGRRLIVGGGGQSFDKPAEGKVIDTATGREVCTLRGHRETVWGGTLSPDGQIAVTCSRDGSVKVWDADTGRELRSFEPGGMVYCVAFSPDGKRLAAGGTRGVAFWEVATWKKADTLLPPPVGGAKSIAFRFDGERLAAVGAHSDVGPGAVNEEPAKGEVRVYALPSGKEVLRINDEDTREVGAVAFSPDGTLLAAAGNNDFWGEGNFPGILIWDAETGKRVRVLQGHTERVFGVAFSPDGKHIASCGEDHTVRLWDVATGKEAAKIRGHWSSVRSVVFSPDGKRLATAGDYDGTARVWDVASSLEYRSLTGVEGIKRVAFSHNGKRLAVANNDGTTTVLDVESGKTEVTLRGHGKGQVFCVVFSPNAKRLFTAGSDKTVRAWDAETGKELFAIPTSDTCECLAVSPDGALIAGGVWTKVSLWDTSLGMEIVSPYWHQNRVSGLAFTRDGRLVSGSGDNNIHVWDLATRKVQRIIKSGLGPVECITLSPDDKTVAAGGSDFVVKVWSTETGAELLTLRRHSKNWVSGVAYSPDGRRIASTGHDGMVRLWDAASGHELLTLDAGSAVGLKVVAFSPDGRRLVASGWDGTVRLWEALPP